MEPIQVEFTFTPESFGKAQMYIMLRFLKTGWLKWIALLGIVMWLGLKGYAGRLNFMYLANTALLVFVFAGVWWIVFRWLSRRNFSKFPNLQHPIQYLFKTADVQLNTHTTEGILQWETFQQAEEAKDFFLLYQNAFAASPILKSGFQNEIDLERFRDLLRSKNLLKQ